MIWSGHLPSNPAPGLGEIMQRAERRAATVHVLDAWTATGCCRGEILVCAGATWDRPPTRRISDLSVVMRYVTSSDARKRRVIEALDL